MSKNTQIVNEKSLQDNMRDGELILWQGKPVASMFEYIIFRPHNLTADRSEFSCGNLVYAIGLLAGVGTMGLIGILLLNMFAFVENFRWFQITVCFIAPLFVIFVSLVFMVIYWMLFEFIHNCLMSLIEKSTVKYVITNKRIILEGFVLLFIEYSELIGAEIGHSQQGFKITWRYSDLGWKGIRHNDFPPFLGLNDFDVQQILNLVEEHAIVELMITDKRESTVSA